MKIKELNTYQSVKFQGKQENFFSPVLLQMKDIEMETIEWGILIKSAKDEVIVTFNNIAYAKPAPLETSKPAEAKKTAKA